MMTCINDKTLTSIDAFGVGFHAPPQKPDRKAQLLLIENLLPGRSFTREDEPTYIM